MPEVEEHLRQAAHNLRVAKELEKIALDWAVTAYFYVAAHVVRAYLSQRGERFGSHKGVRNRLETLVENGDLDKTILTDYLTLFDTSFEARYNCVPVDNFKEVLPEVKEMLRGIIAYFTSKVPELSKSQELQQYLNQPDLHGPSPG
jgi:uncharacterized protein (UPF0332 family)